MSNILYFVYSLCAYYNSSRNEAPTWSSHFAQCYIVECVLTQLLYLQKTRAQYFLIYMNIYNKTYSCILFVVFWFYQFTKMHVFRLD